MRHLQATGDKAVTMRLRATKRSFRRLHYSRAMTLVLEWATEHRDELMEDWNLCSQLKPPKVIEPLK